ncbi:transaldolase family protein [Geitlerinema sp. PCC 9228]|uniref:transaldolase family protein n=1 Tax=Geitlerinema sp. PCC 9228 TaxID=111611 RepID=UPI0008F9C866|nr:transaldolase family protein [Geitlerinema sp. PCC 9228]
MALYLDSAMVRDAEVVKTWGWVKGITTNPTLLAKSDRPVKETLRKLAELTPGVLYYQLTATDVNGMVSEGKAATDLIGNATVLKIPATETGFQALARLSPEITCSVTAIYSPAQALVAKEGGAKYAIVYLNRATRLMGDGTSLLREVAKVLQGSRMEILTASIKSSQEAADAAIAGSHHLTLPLETLRALTTHEFSQQNIDDFQAQGVGLL